MNHQELKEPANEPVPRLDSLRDMDEIQIGDLNGRHIGLQIRIPLQSHRSFYGRIVYIEHAHYSTFIQARWNGKLFEYRGAPQTAGRIETSTGDFE